MIGWTIAAVFYIAFTVGLACVLNIMQENWWKSLGLVLMVEVGAVVFYVLVAVMMVAIQRGI